MYVRRISIRVFLFGSFARGDHTRSSDYDLAFKFEPSLESAWTRLYLDLLENAPTLRKLDLVNMNTCGIKILDSIKKRRYGDL
ncbi:MAG: nucleotidyltransferase domain-containing protein [Bdellovibrionales bacterium]|nr:nucleotidyltransferase domain-containing protein [Bdellovibrionales bacterium]